MFFLIFNHVLLADTHGLFTHLAKYIWLSGRIHIAGPNKFIKPDIIAAS